MKSEFDAKKFVQLFMAGYVPRSKDEKKFVDKHVAQLHQDVNGNKDDVFKATNVPTHARPPYHGYNKGQDERMYEAVKTIDKYGLDPVDHEEIKNSTVVSKHEGKDGHTAEVRYRKDVDMYSVHHYLDGEHMGSSNITFHEGDKKDAEATARYTTTTRNSDYTKSKKAPSLEKALSDIKKVRKWYGSEPRNPSDRAFPDVKDGRGIKEAIEALEEEMTDAQMAKRERIVKSMKKKSATFEKRYGDKAKDVMYATATKMAMEDLNYVNLDMTDEVYALIEEYEEKEDREKKGLKHIESHAKKVREVTKKYPVAQRNESVIDQMIAAMDLDEEIITITFDNGEEAELERDIAESILNIFSDLSEENQFNFEEAISEGIEAFEHALAFIAEAYEGAE